MRKKMTGLKLKIIVVDDDPVIGKLLTRFLTEQQRGATAESRPKRGRPRSGSEGGAEENYAVTAFTSGKDALDYLKSQIPPNPPLSKGGIRGDFACGVGLLLTDLQMPEMTGIELARQVKILYPALPIIVMSGSADGEARDEIFSLGADFISKPFDLAELLKRIQQAGNPSKERR
jgi:CheY-like chemotaxis protein